MAKDTTKRLTEGKPMTLIIGFALPVFVGLLFQQFYSLVDTIIVGKTLGVNALAAVGSTGSVTFLTIGFCTGLCSGFAIPVAQRFGAQDYKRLRQYVANSAWLSIIFAAGLTILTMYFCSEILTLMRTPSDIFDDAYAYLYYIFLGIPVTFLYNLTAGIIRSLGDSKTPVYFLLLASGLNIVLDLYFIMSLGIGVRGAAVATVISQLVSGVACLVFMIMRFPLLHMEKDDKKLRLHDCKRLLGIGLPMGLQYSITAIGSVILQTSVNTLGSAIVAAVTAANRLGMFLVCPFDALGSTMATYCAQNVGAGKLPRLKEGVKAAMILGCAYAAIAFVIIFFFSKYMLLLFLDSDETAILANASFFIIIQAAFYVTLAAVNIFRFAIQGMGFSTLAILSGVSEMVARILVAVFLVPPYGLTGAAFASPVAWIFADAFLIPAFFKFYNILEKRFAQRAKPEGYLS